MGKERNFRSIKKPKGIVFDENDNEIRITLDGFNVQDENMQAVCNAFEGWAVAARACILDEKTDKTVCLDVKPMPHYCQGTDKAQYQGHLARFLYRAMRFDEQYDWFRLSDSLANEVKAFRNFLENGVFVNNIASRDAGNTEREEDENAVEEILSKKAELDDYRMFDDD